MIRGIVKVEQRLVLQVLILLHQLGDEGDYKMDESELVGLSVTQLKCLNSMTRNGCNASDAVGWLVSIIHKLLSLWSKAILLPFAPREGGFVKVDDKIFVFKSLTHYFSCLNLVLNVENLLDVRALDVALLECVLEVLPDPSAQSWEWDLILQVTLDVLQEDVSLLHVNEVFHFRELALLPEGEPSLSVFHFEFLLLLELLS